MVVASNAFNIHCRQEHHWHIVRGHRRDVQDHEFEDDVSTQGTVGQPFL